MGSSMGLMWHGDRAARETARLDSGRLVGIAKALRSVGVRPEPVVYNDDFRDEVLDQVKKLDAVQVWVNPIEGGRDRSMLDQLLREAAVSGVQVNTHPDTILRMGTKQVLVDTSGMGWATDVAAYGSLEQLKAELPAKLMSGPRVLKQLRGHSGGGIWRFALPATHQGQVKDDTLVLLRHAQRGSTEITVSFAEAAAMMEPYFATSGRMIDQVYQPRLPEGMIRVYVVEEKVGGFGHQTINALYVDAEGAAQEPGQRLYYPPDQPEFQRIKGLMESQWIDEVKKTFGMSTADLPLLWDADFMFGPKDATGQDTYVLCEINVSAVWPYPEWADPLLAATAARRISDR